MSLQDEERIKLLSAQAMTALLRSLYSDPGMLNEFNKVAIDSKRTLHQEIAFQCYSLASTMLAQEKLSLKPTQL